VALQKRLDGPVLYGANSTDVFGILSPGCDYTLLISAFASIGGGFVSPDSAILGDAIPLLRPASVLLLGGARLFPFEQARNIASQRQSAQRTHTHGQG
jgi:hypothetical protein